MTSGTTLAAAHFVRIAGLILALCLAMPGTSAAQASGTSQCDAACLTAVVERFITAVTTGRSADVPLSQDVEVRENTRRVELEATTWKDVKAVRSSVIFADPVSLNVVARTGVELADGTPAYLSTRLRIAGSGRITDVEISADRSPQVVSEYVWNLGADLASVLPADQRITRVELEALGRRYFQSLSTHVAVQADFDPRCDRFHSGQQITNAGNNTVEAGAARTCASSLEGTPPWGPASEHRFPVIDPERGIVFGVALLHYLSGTTPRQMYVSEVFKVVGGRIVHIDNIGLMMDGVETMGFVR